MANVKEYSVAEKPSSLMNLQRIHSKLEEIAILKGELTMEVNEPQHINPGLTARGAGERWVPRRLGAGGAESGWYAACVAP